ncbi:GNAT family N-acetyltransferase [Antrihabitans spumae]|uniref:GNAT family N-acetyltransferase n=1 Tax=Antrihabitans spumae TaxID=3373370 RepID=A0ABW7KQS9_9NOCA
MATIRSAKADDIPALAEVLSVAFYRDPVMCHLWPNDKQRAARMPIYLAANLRHHHVPAGGVDVAEVGTTIVGVAVWDPPGHWTQSTTGLLRSLPALIRALGTRLPAAARLRRTLDAVHPRTPHWYMCLLATKPELQTTGVARTLLAYGLERADSAGEPTYGAATRAVMTPFYRSLGFGDYGDPISLSSTGPQLLPLWRDAPTGGPLRR